MHAFGLAFRSSLALPELNEGSADTRFPEVRVEWGEVPAELPVPHRTRSFYQAGERELVLNIPQLARYHVRPDCITIAPEAGADLASIRLCLFGTAVGALLHLHGILALHASAVRLPDGKGAALFSGVSTAGKSTLAAALARKGYPPLADDISAVHFDAAGAAWLYPGLARCKLWGNAIDALQLGPESGEPIRLLPGRDKYALRMQTWDRPERLTHVYELNPVDQGGVALEAVTGVHKLALLDRQTYAPRFIADLNLKSGHLLRLGKLAPQIDAAQIRRPIGPASSVAAIIALLERRWERAGQPA